MRFGSVSQVCMFVVTSRAGYLYFSKELNDNRQLPFLALASPLLIYEHSEQADLLEGEVEVDESYFGGRRKGKPGRCAAGKVPVWVFEP